MTVVTDDLIDVVARDAVITVVLAGSGGERIGEAYDASDNTLVTSYQDRPGSDGTWSLTLTGNDDITPAGTRWRRTISMRDGHESTTYAEVPTTGTHEWSTILTDAPGAVSDGALSAHLSDTDAHGYGSRLLTVSSDVASVSTALASATASLAASISRVDRKIPIVKVWESDGWDAFDTQWEITPDGSQSFALSVTGRRGRFAPTQSSGGNQREWLLDSAASYTNSEIRSLWYGQASDTNPCQLGHVHRAQFSGGVYRGIVAWSNIAFSILSSLQLNAWQEVEGTTTLQQGTGTSLTDVTSIERSSRIRYARRIDAFDVSQYWTLNEHMYGLVSGDVVDITGMNLSTFNRTDVTLSGAAGTGFFQISDTVASDSSDALASGLVTPNLQVKRYFPYMVASRLIGNTLSVKRWRPEDPEPDWGVAAACTSVTIAAAGTMSLPTDGPGYSGILIAHGLSGSYGEYGTVSIRELDD